MDRQVSDKAPPRLDIAGLSSPGARPDGYEVMSGQSTSKNSVLTPLRAHEESSASESEYQHALEVVFDADNVHRRRSSLVNTRTIRQSSADRRQDTACFVHSLLETGHKSSRSGSTHLGDINEDTKADKGIDTASAVATHSRLLTKKQLSDMAYGVRELSKRLGSVRLKLRVKTVFVLTKAHDETLIGYTRELVEWLLAKERETPYIVCVNWDYQELVKQLTLPRYVENTLENNSKFDAQGIVSQDPSREARLKYWTNDLAAKYPQTFDFVITLGGDGTLLYASWLFQRIVPPVLSFSLGSLGFLTKFDYSGFRETLITAFNDGVTVSLRLRFEGTVMRTQHKGQTNRDLVEELIGEEADNDYTHKPDGSHEILNDIVVDRGPNPTMSAIEIFGDDEHFTTVQADGVCVATPTGSTAYNLAAGGSLCHPENPVILVTAICAHTLSFRPIILPDTIVLRVGVPYDSRTSSWASFDGRERVELCPGDYVTISASRYPFANVMQQGRRSEDWCREAVNERAEGLNSPKGPQKGHKAKTSTGGSGPPSSFLRRSRGQSHPPAPMPHAGGKGAENAVDRDQRIGLATGIVSAPLWDSKTSTFAGLLTTSDYINLIQYYWQNPEAVNQIDQFKLSSLRDIEKAIGVQPLETISIHPQRPLYEACRSMLESKARRIPLVDIDDETKRALVVNVVTQYRILKFVAVNVSETQLLRKPLRQLGLGTYKHLQTARMETPVFDVIHQLVNYSISSVPILNSDGKYLRGCEGPNRMVTNVFEAVDVITIIKGGMYDELNLNVGEALQKRPEDFPGIYTCSIDDRLDTIFDTIRKSRVHRLVVIDEDNRLVGILTLSDILEYILLEGEGDDGKGDDTDNLLSPNRPRNRSSLDTFLIPGRTRVPSHNPQPFDVQVAQSLLKSNMEAVSRAPRPYTKHAERRLTPQRISSAPLTGSEFEHDVDYEIGESLYRPRCLTSRPGPPRIASRDGLVIPHRQAHLGGLRAHSQRDEPQRHEALKNKTTYDGPQDSSCGSRATSTSYSMVSRRILTDSSSSSWGYKGSRFNEEYNHLAAKHGLPVMELTHSATNDNPSVKSKTKEPKNGWLKRKFFHHSSTTFTYKARTTYRSVPRKKSFSSVPSLTDGGRKDILDGKTLEETCRLGGLGVLVLPVEYAVDKLTLPTCLSAAATYLLKFGVNAPGLFRVSGQTATVNALYEHFAHQFYQAGSPSKVQETVKPGLLPANIEFTVSDVASMFKKIIIGLPGGLLGSLGLFEAIRATLLKLEPDPDISEAGMTSLRAKLIALAVLSMTSTHRVCLIQAVLGLVAHLANEAEIARGALQNEVCAPDAVQPWKPPSELMGYQSLGVCLGPLLLGDLIDRVLVQGEATESEPRTSTDSTKKAKKKRVSVAENKIEKDIHLVAHVDRANLTASIMQSLLKIWKDVVIQLRVIQGARNPLPKSRKESQVNKSSRRNGSRLTLRSSDEERRLLDFLRGRTLPEDLVNGAIMKEKIKFKRRSPVPWIVVKALDDSPLEWTWFPTQGDVTNDEEHQQQATNKSNGRDTIQLVEQHVLNEAAHQSDAVNEGIEEGDKQVDSGAGVDQMAMGQILPPRDVSRRSSGSSQHRRSNTYAWTPRRAKMRSSSDVTPETAVRNLSRSDMKLLPNWHYYSKSLDKPLPPLKVGLPPPPVPGTPKRKQSFPPRQSSLPMGSQAPTRPEHTPGISVEFEDGEKIEMTDKTCSISLQPSAGNIIRKEPNGPGGVPSTPHRATFSERAKMVGKGRTQDSLTVIPAYINPLLTPPFPLEDPFITSTSSILANDTLIPKPVNEAGRIRKAEGRSPSPQKTALSPKKALGDPDNDAEMVKRNTIVSSKSSPVVQRAETGPTFQDFEAVPTRPLSAYTADALQRMKSVLEEPPTTQHGTNRVVSFESSSRPNSMLDTSPGSFTTVKRSGSNNATLYAEITRLKRQLEQKTEEVQATRRSLDAARATKEEGTDDCSVKRGSWNKGTLSAEVRETKKEMQSWKRRAEWAEKRLAGLGALPVEVVSDE
ncbi:MAG: hypothetical protein Q9217_005732 [Psora testacea]